MQIRGLKTSLIINLLLVLAGAMLLIDLVMIGTSRRAQLNERLATGQTLLAGALALRGEAPLVSFAFQLNDMLLAAGATCLEELDLTGRSLTSLGDGCQEPATRLRAEGVKALNSGRQSAIVGSGRLGLFWSADTSLVVARPLFARGEKSGALAAELSLASLSQNLASSQRLFLIYFLINLVLFIMLGFFRLYRSIVKPIDRLVATAEEFRDDGEVAFPPAAREGEFNRLSASLNRMLSRINRDRTRLAETVNSLEEANRGLRRAQQEIIRAEKMASVGRLSAGVAHEIGNPIGIIIGYLELLKQSNLTEEQKKDFLRRAEGEANRVNHIIRQLLDFSRISPEQQVGPLGVHDLLREVLELCQVQPLMTGINFALETGAKRDLVLGSGDQLKQVFLNLLINGADAINSLPSADRQGHILIRTTNPEPTGPHPAGAGLLQIEVIDNGPGFGGEQLANVFDPFYTTKEPGKGTGLGLSICFSIVENLGGEIRAADASGGGASITVLLPLAGPEAHARPVNNTEGRP